MTLILSCITQDYVLQVSDRRLTLANNGQIYKNDENKAINFWGLLAMSYTGLSSIHSTPTDIWLGKVMLGCSSIVEVVEAIKENATREFKRMIWTKREWKHHAFIGVGWRSVEPIYPLICIVSNYHNEQGEELVVPTDDFMTKIIEFPTNSHEGFSVVAIGQPVSFQIAQRLKRNLARCVKHSDVSGPQSLLKFLIDAMREVADTNQKVGKDLLAVCLPKRTIGRSILRMSDGSLAWYSLASPPLKDVQSFTHIGENQRMLKGYGPNFVVGNTLLRGYFELNNDGHLGSVGTRIVKLEDGAKAGICIINGNGGQFISPPNKHVTFVQ